MESPVVNVLAELNPIMVLFLPSVFLYKAFLPIAVLLSPLIFVNSALSPTAVLFLPSVLLSKVDVPKAILFRLPWSYILICPLKYVFCIVVWPKTTVLSPSPLAEFPITIWSTTVLSCTPTL